VIRLLVRLISIFEKKDYIKFIFLGAVIFLSSFFEIIGIGLLLPFIALLGKPDLVTKNGMISRVYHYFHFQSFSQFMIIIAMGVAAVFITFWQIKFLFERKISLKVSPFSIYLTRRNAFH
jgi:ATP-binding cassette, subfamily B, bacterial PglK